MSPDTLKTILATRCASRSTRTSRRGGDSETFGRADGGVGDQRRTGRNHETHETHENGATTVAIVCPEESYRIMGAFCGVYKQMGCGFLEPVYQKCLEIELALQGIPFKPQDKLMLSYKGRLLTFGRADGGVGSSRRPGLRSTRTSKGAWLNSRSSSAVIPRASRRCRRARREVLEGEELAKIAESGPFWPAGRSGDREQPKSWYTGLYGDGTRDRQRAGRFFARDPMAHRREK
jgi:hypothetical protein